MTSGPSSTIDALQRRSDACALVAKRTEEAIKAVLAELGRQTASTVFAASADRDPPYTAFDSYLLATCISAPLILEALQSLPFEPMLDAFRDACMKRIQELDRGQTDGGRQ